MATTFMAVQCFSCSTMQVKQRKNSSNKWTCVVCNVKQSVRKVYATNSMAKHVRSFVQSFNMSRKFADDECLHHQTLTEEQIPQHPPPANDNCKRKSTTDWTAYLDPVEQDDVPQSQPAEDTHGPKVVTELPAEMFKKQRLRRSDPDPKGNERLYKPNFSKRANSSAADCRQSLQGMKSKNDCISSGCKEGSRWTAYLTQEEEDEQGITGGFNAHPRNCSADIDIASGSEAFTTMDQLFEEDIHPDFK